MRRVFTILSLLFATLTVFAENLSLETIKGHRLSIDSFAISSDMYKGHCDAKAMKDYTYINFMNYGSSDAFIFQDDIQCEKRPNFNVLQPFPISGKDSELMIVMGNGRGVIPGLFTSEEDSNPTFKVNNPVYFTAQCRVTKYPFYKFGFGEVLCTDASTGSWIKMIVD